jgi:hypothetical protein
MNASQNRADQSLPRERGIREPTVHRPGIQTWHRKDRQLGLQAKHHSEKKEWMQQTRESKVRRPPENEQAGALTPSTVQTDINTKAIGKNSSREVKQWKTGRSPAFYSVHYRSRTAKNTED